MVELHQILLGRGEDSYKYYPISFDDLEMDFKRANSEDYYMYIDPTTEYH